MNPQTVSSLTPGFANPAMMGLLGMAMYGIVERFLGGAEVRQRRERESRLTQAPLSAEQASQERELAAHYARARHRAWLDAKDVYVDPERGDDEEDGLTASTAIQSLTEANRRWNTTSASGSVRRAGLRSVHWIKKCSLDDHEALKFDDAKWNALEKKPDWRIGSEVLEQRDCPRCHSTIARFKDPTEEKKR